MNAATGGGDSTAAIRGAGVSTFPIRGESTGNFCGGESMDEFEIGGLKTEIGGREGVERVEDKERVGGLERGRREMRMRERKKIRKMK